MELVAVMLMIGATAVLGFNVAPTFISSSEDTTKTLEARSVAREAVAQAAATADTFYDSLYPYDVDSDFNGSWDSDGDFSVVALRRGLTVVGTSGVASLEGEISLSGLLPGQDSLIGTSDDYTSFALVIDNHCVFAAVDQNGNVAAGSELLADVALCSAQNISAPTFVDSRIDSVSMVT